MALTSERLKELTKQRMELIREIDKRPGDESLKERMSLIVLDISKERHSLIAEDAISASQIAAASCVSKNDEESSLIEEPSAEPKVDDKKNGSVSRKYGKTDGSKKLSDYF